MVGFAELFGYVIQSHGCWFVVWVLRDELAGEGFREEGLAQAFGPGYTLRHGGLEVPNERGCLAKVFDKFLLLDQAGQRELEIR